jgi:hypothetical protein
MTRNRDGRTRRKIGNRTVRKRFLIVCEGEKTEPNYFKSFRATHSVIEIHVHGEGANTTSLVELAKKPAEREGFRAGRDALWVVFDKDDFTKEQMNTAVARAKHYEFNVAWSNQSFELWYLLHFQFCDSALHRSLYIERLEELLGQKYRKNDPNMYYRLLDLQDDAIRNAERLVMCHSSSCTPADADPCTRVHELVKALNKASNPPPAPSGQ